MISRSNILTLSLLFLLLTATFSSAQALTITNAAPGWPVSPFFETGTSADVGQGNGIANPGRIYAGQTFTVPSTFKVSDIYIHLRPQGGNNTSEYRVKIYEISSDPTTLAIPTLGTAVYDTGSFTMDSGTVGSLPGGSSDRVFRFSLSTGEQFNLGPRPASTGYALQFEGVSGGGFQYGYSTGGGSGNFYSGGHVYFSSGTEGLLDSPIAFAGAEVSSVPEPSTYALGLIGLAGLGLAAWRKKRDLRFA